MSLDDLMTNTFNKIIEGERINKKVGDWSISNLNSPIMVELRYRTNAYYGFQIMIKEDEIEFYNYHRESTKGTGTKTLKQLELAFGALAKIKGQKIVVSFDPFGQKSTEAWLKKNGYVLNNRVYQKEFG